MKLYRVTCSEPSHSWSARTLDVYVVADNETDAAEAAIAEMKFREWRYDSHATNIERVAAETRYPEPAILIRKEPS